MGQNEDFQVYISSYKKVWLFQFKAVPLYHEPPPSLSMTLKCAGRFYFDFHLCQPKENYEKFQIKCVDSSTAGRNTPDKMEKTGWAVEQAPNVKAPVFTDFPMTLECRVKQKIDEADGGYNLVGEIVNILCDEKYLAEDGKPDVEKMNLITYDPVHHAYIQLGKTVGKAFADGKQLK